MVKTFEQEHGRHLWRVQRSEHLGRVQLNIWPFFRKGDDQLLPCITKYGGGFNIPIDRVPELIAVLQSIERGSG